MKEQKIKKIFDRQAMLYQKESDLGILSKWRKQLIPFAHGDVLELAVGTGNNFPFYQPEVHITAIDISQKMLEKADIAAKTVEPDITLMLGNAETVLFPENTFDTVVSTLSFCGYEDPLTMFKRVYDWLRPGGTLLLFEHGISDSRKIACVQNRFDTVAKRVIGCHQNRRIMQMIQQLPFQIETHYHFVKGIFHVVRATSIKPDL